MIITGTGIAYCLSTHWFPEKALIYSLGRRALLTPGMEEVSWKKFLGKRAVSDSSSKGTGAFCKELWKEYGLYFDSDNNCSMEKLLGKFRSWAGPAATNFEFRSFVAS